jgi:hypothetical protein
VQETVISGTVIVLPVNWLQLTVVQIPAHKDVKYEHTAVKERRRKGEVVETKSEKEKERNKGEQSGKK